MRKPNDVEILEETGDLREMEAQLKDNLHWMRKTAGTGGSTAMEAIEAATKNAEAAKALGIDARLARPKDLYRLKNTPDPRSDYAQTAHALNRIKREAEEDLVLVADSFDRVGEKLKNSRDKEFLWTLDVLIGLSAPPNRIRLFKTILATPQRSVIKAHGVSTRGQLEQMLDENNNRASVLVDSASSLGVLEDLHQVENCWAAGTLSPDTLQRRHCIAIEGLLRLVDSTLRYSHKNALGEQYPSPVLDCDPVIAFHLEGAISFALPFSRFNTASGKSQVASFLSEFVELTQDRTRFYDPESKCFYSDPERARAPLATKKPMSTIYDAFGVR